MIWTVIKLLLCFLLAALFGFLFYQRYWKYAECIQQAISGCVSEQGLSLSSGGMVWIIPCIVFVVLGGYQCIRLFRR